MGVSLKSPHTIFVQRVERMTCVSVSTCDARIDELSCMRWTMLRIDYVMCSHDIDIKDYRIMDECTLSDHLPVAVRMKRIK